MMTKRQLSFGAGGLIIVRDPEEAALPLPRTYGVDDIPLVLGVLVMALSRLDAWSVIANARLSEREIDVLIDHAGPRRVLYTAQVSADAASHASRHGPPTIACPAPGAGSSLPLMN